MEDVAQKEAKKEMNKKEEVKKRMEKIKKNKRE